MAQLETEAVAVERLARAYAGLARARLEACNADLVVPPIPVSPGQLQLVVSA